MKTSTNFRPLIINYMAPKKPEVVSASDVSIVYDPYSQVSYYMGGGKSGPSRSYDGYKATRHHITGATYRTENDAERWTDD